MKQKLLTLSLLLVGSLTFAQTPCVGGSANGYPCSGYDLMSHLPLSTFNTSGANDSWGWTDPDDGTEYYIMGLEDGTAFLDISDPVNPVYLGKLPTQTSATTWRDIKVYQDHAFIVSEAGGHGMQVFDLTRLRDVASPPENFTADVVYNGFGNAHNIVINEETGYAYGVGTDTFSGGVHFVDISDPLNPVAAGGYGSDGYIHDAQIVTYNGPDADYQGREIMISSNGGEEVISVVDITDKNNPVGISTMAYPQSGYTHQGWFTEDHRFFLLGDEFDEGDFGFNTRTVVFDLADMDDPILDFEYFGPEASIDHNGYVLGDAYYLANYSAGLRKIDISDIENGNMTELRYFDSYPNNNSANYSGVWNVYPYFESGVVVINDRSGGMFIVAEGSLGNEDFDLNAQLSIAPNPATDLIQIQTANSSIRNIQVVDLSGKVLMEDSGLDTFQLNLDISNLASGMYFVNVNGQATKKIIKN